MNKYAGLIGGVLVIAGGLSPMLHIPIIGNWNFLDIDTVLSSVVFIMAALGLLGAALNRPGLQRFAGWAVLAVVIFAFVAVYFKVNNYFSFIPLKKLAAAASGLIHYRWLGWILMLAGALTLILTSRPQKTAKAF